MLGYSWSKEDFREVLYRKYIPMKEAIYIMGIDCNRCHIMKPHVEKWASNNGYEFQEHLFDDENVKQFQIESVPMLVLREDGVVSQILNEEGIVNLISNSK